MPRYLSVRVLCLFALALGAVHCLAADGNPNLTVYLLSTFKEPEQDGLRFAYSFDGYHWTNVPGLFLEARAGKGLMRDPSVLRGPDGTYQLVWTTGWQDDKGFGYAHSRDLVHWSEQQFIPVMEREPTTVNVWAPELFYDGVGKRFIICWASAIPGRFPDHLEQPRNNQRMYYTTTTDFKSFTPTKLFLDPDFSVIDCRILKDGGRYVLLLKDNSRPERDIKVAFGKSPLGPWTNISESFSPRYAEGPTALKIGDDWLIYFDKYREKTFGAVKTRDFEHFTNITEEMTFPEGLKHGTAFKATRKELNELLQAGEKQVRNEGRH